jgi:hypothetical protein
MVDEFAGPFRPARVRHLSSAEIAQYLDAATDHLNRQRIEAHLVRCDACLDEVLATLRFLRSTPQPPLD